jgi:hypothetical protein
MGVLGLKRSADVRSLVFNTMYFALLACMWKKPALSDRGDALWFGVLSYFSFIGAVCVHNTIHTPSELQPRFVCLLALLPRRNAASASRSYTPSPPLVCHQPCRLLVVAGLFRRTAAFSLQRTSPSRPS